MKISGQLLKRIIEEEVKKNFANLTVTEEATAEPKSSPSTTPSASGVGVGKAQAKAAGSKSDVERAFEVMLNDKKLAPLIQKIDTTQEKAQLLTLVINQFSDKSDVKKVLTLALSILSKQQ